MSATCHLDRIDHLPSALAHARRDSLASIFPNPTLITLSGTKSKPLFLSLLLHGNETTSFDVLKWIYLQYADQPPPRSLMIFIGNVEATAQNIRYLPGRPDFNRIWSQGSSPEHALAKEVTKIARAARPFASIDVHNNTGSNPLYGCVNTLRPVDLALAAMFSPMGVYYQNPSTTQSVAFSHFCPAITIECGQNGDSAGLTAAIDLINRVMQLDELPTRHPGPNELRLFETIGRVIVDPDCDFEFSGQNADLSLPDDLEMWNFKVLPAGFAFGCLNSEKLPLRVVDEHDTDLTSSFFDVSDKKVFTIRSVIPSMITRDKRNIRQDCLCYFMQQIAI